MIVVSVFILRNKAPKLLKLKCKSSFSRSIYCRPIDSRIDSFAFDPERSQKSIFFIDRQTPAVDLCETGLLEKLSITTHVCIDIDIEFKVLVIGMRNSHVKKEFDVFYH